MTQNNQEMTSEVAANLKNSQWIFHRLLDLRFLPLLEVRASTEAFTFCPALNFLSSSGGSLYFVLILEGCEMPNLYSAHFIRVFARAVFDGILGFSDKV